MTDRPCPSWVDLGDVVAVCRHDHDDGHERCEATVPYCESLTGFAEVAEIDVSWRRPTYSVSRVHEAFRMASRLIATALAVGTVRGDSGGSSTSSPHPAWPFVPHVCVLGVHSRYPRPAGDAAPVAPPRDGCCAELREWA